MTYELPWVGDVYFYGGFNIRRPPFNDVRVRQAALYGIDREGMAKAIGFGTPYYYGEWARGTPGYDDSIVKHEYNPAKVRDLLKAAGYPDGIAIELKVIAREPENTIGEIVQQMWTEVGIKTKLVAMERLAWIDAVRAMNFDTCFWRAGFSFTAGDPEAETARIACGAPSNWAQWCDPDVDRLMAQGAAVADRKKRHDIYREALRTMQERAYLYSGIAVPWVNVARKVRLVGRVSADPQRRGRAKEMGRYLARRLLYFIPVIFLVTVVVFSITMLLPGDSALAFLGEANIRDTVAYEAVRKELGLDRPPFLFSTWSGSGGRCRGIWAGRCARTNRSPARWPLDSPSPWNSPPSRSGSRP